MSTRQSVEAANDNEAVTLRSIERDDADRRVYNFAVQSLSGEVTHNYLVGDAEWWTHNSRSRRRSPPNGYRDGTGKNHDGDLPYDPPKSWGPGDITDVIDELECSIAARGAEMSKYDGGDAGHHERLRREKRFLRRLKGAIGR